MIRDAEAGRDINVSVGASRSLEEDVTRLLATSDDHRAIIEEDGGLAWNGSRVRIVRTVAAPLLAAASGGSLALVGAPGIGKSSLLAELAKKLHDGGAAVLLLCAGELGARSIGQLKTELDLEHQIRDVLCQVPGNRPAFLLIDALDATRGDSGKATAIRQLIRHARSVSDNWHVIASIRQFDLLWSTDWRQLFRAPVSSTGELGDVSHLEVDVLDDSELARIGSEAPGLGALIANAPANLRELLRVPFNLRLAAELGLDATSLGTVTTQLDLLDRYWLERVEGGEGGEARVAVMSDLSRHAVEARTTRIPRTSTTNHAAVEELEHRGVLIRSGDHVEVAHHVVLDYAISRSVFPADGASLGRLVTPDTAIFYRQSTVMWLERIWGENRAGFWTLLFAATQLSVPCVTRIAIAETLVKKVNAATDLQPLVDRLASERVAGVATRTFHFLHGTIVGTAAITRYEPWLEFFGDLAPAANGELLLHLARLIDTLEREQRIASEARPLAARACRALLLAAWRGRQEKNVVVWASRCVVRTFGDDPTESANLLGRAFSADPPVHAAEVIGYLAENVDDLLAAPALVRDVYIYSLEREVSEAATRLGIGQDEMGPQEDASREWGARTWKLKQELGAFFDRSPKEATQAIARATRACEPFRPLRGKRTTHIKVLGRQIDVDDLPQDMDLIWGALGDFYAVVQGYCEKLVSLASTDLATAARLLEILADENAAALVWAALLDASEATRETLQLLDGLLQEPTLLRLFAKHAAPLFARMRTQLSSSQRTRFDDVIDEIERDAIGLDAQERLRAAFDRPGATRARSPEVEFEREGIDRILLAERGMLPSDIDAPQNIAIQRLEQEADGAIAKLASSPSPETVRDGQEALEALALALDGGSIHEAQQRSAWGTAAQLATALASAGEQGALRVMLAAATKQEPLPNAKHDRQFAENPGWGTGFARIEAAQGLVVYANKWEDPSAVDALRVLANDQSPVVRYQVARGLRVLMKRAPSVAWELVETFIVDDNATVVEAALQSFALFFFTDRDRAIAFVLRAHEHVRGDRPGTRRVNALCWQILIDVHVLFEHPAVDASMNDLIANVDLHAESVERAMQSIRPRLRTDDTENRARQRAGALLRRIVAQACARVRANGETDAVLNATSRANRTPLARLISAISHQIYFASGAHQAADEESIPSEQRLQVLRELGDVMIALGQAGIVEASDHILDTLDEYVRGVEGVDVEALLPMFLAIARSATEHGYQFGWRGFDVIDQTVRWYLAERPDLLETTANLWLLSSTVDAFVDAGWPAAFRLARDLGQMR